MVEKEINLNDVVKYLNRAFAKAAYKASNNLGKSAVRFKNDNGEWDTTTLYDYQVDFAYLINKIQREPTYASRKAIQAANELIRELDAESEPTYY
jgi:hypothetical protein